MVFLLNQPRGGGSFLGDHIVGGFTQRHRHIDRAKVRIALPNCSERCSGALDKSQIPFVPLSQSCATCDREHHTGKFPAFFFHFIRTDSCMNVHQCTANVHFAMESLGAGESWSFRQAIRRGIKLARRGPLMTRNVLMVYRRRAATSARVSWPTIAGSCSMKWLSVHLSWPRSLIPPTPHLTFTSPSPLSTFPPPLSEKVLRSRQHWGTL